MRLALGKAAPPLELEAGTVIHGYGVEGIAGRHVGLELVCDAIDPDGEPVSLVVALIPPSDRHGWAEFRHRARLRASLRHPALLPVRAAGELTGRPYIVTDRYPDLTFADLIGSATLTPAEAFELLVPACEALDLAHEHGMVHQSLSSSSLLVGPGGPLLDSFGVVGWPARPTVESLEHRDSRYASPEELAGRALEPASNIYSLASMLVEAADPERSSMTRAYVHLFEPSPLAWEDGERPSSALDRIIARGVASDPARRQLTASGLLNEAAAALGVGLPAPTPAKPPPTLRPEAPREGPVRRGPRRRISAAVAAVLALAALAGGVTATVLRPFDGGGETHAAESSPAPALFRLDNRRTELRDRLAAATTPQEQSALAAGLATSYSDAAQAIGSDSMADAARRAASAYTELAAAAESGDRAAFTDASSVVGSAEQRFMAVATRR